jgi:hypothetical protein
MRDDQRQIIEEIQKTFDMKVATENVASDVQKTLADQCKTAHKLGLSDRQVADSIGLSRTRVQQLRTQ